MPGPRHRALTTIYLRGASGAWTTCPIAGIEREAPLGGREPGLFPRNSP